MASVLAIGGAGYIGTHVCLALLEAGHDVMVLDDLTNSKFPALRRVEEIAGRSIVFKQVDMTDRGRVAEALEGERIDGVVLLAGLKSVEESVRNPSEYYRVNVGGAATMLAYLEKRGVRNIVFSSSATVYAPTSACPLEEGDPLGPVNPYGETKLAIERILDACAAANLGWRAVSLRYFNPVGAHPSGRIGEDPLGVPTNLFPVIAQVAGRRRQQVDVFGDDYPTVDGTGVRDFIHVQDLAEAHVAALDLIDRLQDNSHIPINVGVGTGVSVRQCLDIWESVVGYPIPARVVGRRPGDVAECYAEVSKAQALLGWTARRDLTRMCEDHWRFQQANPLGYAADE